MSARKRSFAFSTFFGLFLSLVPALAETIIIPSIPGTLDGANGVNGIGGPGTFGGLGGNASATANAPVDLNNTAIATAGNGGNGGNGSPGFNGGNGGVGGNATATAATSFLMNNFASANATGIGGNGGNVGGSGVSPSLAVGGSGGNATSNATAGELMPQAATVGYVIGDQIGRVGQELISNMIAAGRSFGREVIVLKCRSAEDFETAFATLVERSAGALVVSAFPTAYNNRAKILALAARHKIPTIYPQSEYAYEGGLMSYSPVINLRRIAVDYIVPILKGAKPADLPVQRPTKYQLVINLKTAKALGLTVPLALQVGADEVIE